MGDKDKRVTPQEFGALGVGLTVTIASSLLTSLVSPIMFPFNILISVGLGASAGYGTLKVLDPRSQQDLLDAQTTAQYQKMLKSIAEIAGRTAKASQSLRQRDDGVTEKLGHIARMMEMILARYQERPRDYSGVSATLLILQRFDEILAHYLKLKHGELFMDKEQKVQEIADAEKHVLPMFETALDNLGKKLDAGEALDQGVSQGTLESMLRSLNLIQSSSDQIGASYKKGDSR